MHNHMQLSLQGATQAGGTQEGVARPATYATAATDSLTSKVRSAGVCMGLEQRLPHLEPCSSA